MLNYMKTRLATFLRTKSSLMLTLRRRLHEAVREQEKFENVLLKKLYEGSEAGDVDVVNEEFKKAVETWSKILKRIDDSEKLAFIGEARPLEPIAEIALFLEKLSLKLKEQERNNRDIRKLREEIDGASRNLRKLFSEENETLHDEYLALLRQAEEKRGAIQNFVLSYNNIMETTRTAWSERSETRAVTHEAESIEAVIKRTLALLHSDQGDKETEERVGENLKKIEAEIVRLIKEAEEMLKGFLFMLKAMSDLYLDYDLKDEKALSKYETLLQDTGFPENDLKEIQEELKSAENENKDSAVVVVNAFRRMARLEAGRIREAESELSKAA